MLARDRKQANHPQRSSSHLWRLAVVTLAGAAILAMPRAALAQPRPTAPAPWAPTVEWEWWGSRVVPESRIVGKTPIVIDLDGDARPEVVFVSADRRGRGMLRAVSGVDGSDWLTVDDPRVDLYVYGGLAAGDIDGDCRPEIIGVLRKDANTVEHQRIVAMEHDGTLKWTSPPLFCNGGCDPALADVDQDGSSEIAYGQALLDATGRLRWEHRGWLGLLVGPVLFDLLPAPGLELLESSRVYGADGRLLWVDAASAQFNALANFDEDPEPEVVRVGGSPDPWLALYEPDGRRVWGPIGIPAPSQPVIADLDGDGGPEISVAGNHALSVFEADGRLAWRVHTRDNHYWHDSTAADLDGDGAYELIHQHDLDLTIFDGRDGSVMWEYGQALCDIETSASWHSAPVVADVDADGRAELVASFVASSTGDDAPTHPAIRVYGSDAWAPARRIWNQYTYHVSNILDDGTLPTHELPDWDAHNGFRAAAATGPGPGVCGRPTPATDPSPTPTSPAPPSATPSAPPTATPSAPPTATPSDLPSAKPSAPPSATPSALPSATPPDLPSAKPDASRTPTPTVWPGAARRLMLPILLGEGVKSERQPSDVALAVDTSSSMTGEKMAAVRAAIAAFVGTMALPRDRVALVAFDDEATLLAPLTGDAVAVVNAAATLTLGHGTRLDAGLETALAAMVEARPTAARAIVLLTDGLQVDARAQPVTVAAWARSMGIAVFAVGLGRDADAELLRAVAGDPSHYYPAPEPAGLADIYRRIARVVPCQPRDYWGRRCN